MTEPQSAPLFLGRQPILGREQQVLAYTLVFQEGLIATDDPGAQLDSAQTGTTVIADTFAGSESEQALGPYRAFIKVNHAFLFGELIESLPPQLVVLELDESIQSAPDIVDRCRLMRERGFTLVVHADAMSGDESLESSSPLLDLAEIIAFDLTRLTVDALPAQIVQLQRQGKKLLAQNVGTAEHLTLAQRLGFDLFQGYFFARPTVKLNKKLNPAQLSLVRLLSLVMEDADTSEIENAFKLEPGLTINLLRLTNSVGSGQTTRITSLRHAIAILGRRQLQRWLQLLIYSSTDKAGSQVVNPLLQLAATRGRLMELLAERVQPKNREFSDQSFMVGMLSLMPALLGMAMPDILAQLPVAQRVGLALGEHGGQIGQLLTLVEATEQSDADVLAEALHRLPGLNARLLDSRLAQAMIWANNLGQPQAPEE